MPNALPETVDPWRMVQARRVFEGSLSPAGLPRLLGMLADGSGEIVYRVEFGRDDFDRPYVDVRADAGLAMICQRTLNAYVQAVSVDQRLGLVEDEAQEAALPEACEALLVPDGQLCLRDVIEDELILAVPLVALGPGSPLEQVALTDGPSGDIEQPLNPFAALGQLKTSRH